MEQSIMTAREVADFLKIGLSSVYKMARTGVIPAFKVSKKWRFDQNAINAFIQSQVNDDNPNFSQKTSVEKQTIFINPER